MNDASTALLGACVAFWNILWVSYFHYFFPKMKVLTTRKMLYPVFIYLVIFFLLIVGFSVFFYSMFSSYSANYATFVDSFISVAFFGMGRVAGWDTLVDSNPLLTFFVRHSLFYFKMQ